jgi:hypothetical protein
MSLVGFEIPSVVVMERGVCLASAITLVSCLSYSSTLKIEATCSSEASVNFQRTTWRYFTEDRTLKYRLLAGSQVPRDCRKKQTESKVSVGCGVDHLPVETEQTWRSFACRNGSKSKSDYHLPVETEVNQK